MNVDENLWYVKLADGDVERLTLDQLDEAFQNGQIDEHSMVLAHGSESWVKLSDLLGGGDPEPAAPPVRASQAPTVIPGAPGPVVVYPPPAAAVAAQKVALPSPAIAPTYAAPVQSVRPVSVDLGVIGSTDDLTFPRKSRKGWVFAGIAAVAIIGGAAFFAVKQTSASAAADPAPVFTAAASLPQSAAAAPAPAQPDPAPAPTTGATTAQNGPSSVMDPTQRPSLNDDQRARLMDADKKMKGKAAKAGHASGGAGGGTGGGAAVHHSSKNQSTGFTTGGNKYDPLNSTL